VLRWREVDVLAVLFAMLTMHPSSAQVHTSADKAREPDAAFRAGYAALSSQSGPAD
jgi:hypothetical protein